MSRLAVGMTTEDLRDLDAEDRDEEARRRDRASASRDRDAHERDLRAENKMRAAVQYRQLVGQMLDVGGQRGEQEQAAEPIAVLRDLLSKFDEALQAAESDRLAARDDRQAAAGDRLSAAEDRDIGAAHRGQAAIEREQQVYLASPGGGRGAEVLEAARAACTRAESLVQFQQRDWNVFPHARRDILRQSMVARLQARIDTLPVIEQAKGLIMAQRRCSELEAFEVLRQASQRLNEPIRELAARLVSSNTASGAATPGQGPDVRPGPRPY